VSRFLKAHQHN